MIPLHVGLRLRCTPVREIESTLKRGDTVRRDHSENELTVPLSQCGPGGVISGWRRVKGGNLTKSKAAQWRIGKVQPGEGEGMHEQRRDLDRAAREQRGSF